MPRKLVHFAFLVLLCAPIHAYGLGLGEIVLDSALNEPLRARISLDGVQQGDLTNFKASVASAETFGRYGLDRPDFLTTLRFEVSTDGAQPQLIVRSNSPITEPFVTFLVEANWDSGRLLREYTVLLDPPVFNPEAAAPPVQAPRTATSQVSPGSGFVPRRDPSPAARRPSVAAVAGSSYGPVRRNETLWAIADRARAGSGLTINQMMIAIYRDNPDAFLGNINLLKEGATLSLPDTNQAAQVSRQDAFTQAREHNQRWRAGGTVARTPSSPGAPTAAESDDGRRLRLVAPQGGATDTSGLSALQQQLEEEQTRNRELNDQIETLRNELADNERLFNLRNADLADLQERLAQQQGGAEDTGGDVDVSQIGPEPMQADTTDAADDTPAATVADAPAQAEPADTPPSADAAPAVTAPATTPVASTPKPASAPIQSAPSLLDRVIGFFASVWPFLLGGLALIGGLLFWRSRRGEADDDDTWEALSRHSAVPTSEAPAVSQMEVSEGTATDEDVEFFEDTGTFKPVDFSEAESDVGLERQAADAEAQTSKSDFPFEDTVAGEEEALKLDQSDPLAEADFHIAYGLYDQAADLVRAASEREPERRDLKMKLIEIFFVWGNKDEFLKTARALRDDIGPGPDRDWDKVAIFGKQICPEDDLFSGDSAGAGGGMIDLELDETGEAQMDLETGSSAGDDDMDFDLGDALEAASDSVASVDNVIDFDFSGAATADSDDTADTVREKLEAAADRTEDTEEMDLADMGIDLDFTESIKVDGEFDDASDDSEVIDIDIGEDFDELFGGLDEQPDARPDPGAGTGDETQSNLQVSDETGDKLLDTSELKVEMEELLASAAGMEQGDDEPQASGADSTGSFSAEIKSLADEGVEIDLDFGEPEDDDDVTELMEGIASDDTQEANVADGAGDFVPGSDDETVLSNALTDDGEGLSDDEFGEIFADDADAGTSVIKSEAAGFAGDNDSTVLAQSPFAEADDPADGAGQQAGDEMTFEGVFDDAGDDEPVIDLGGDEFSAAVFGDGDDAASADVTQESAAVDLDVGDALGDSASESGDNTTVKVAARDLALPDLDDGGSSEVGTKLDLARAYMEMGDPDGARGILQEVIEEGDAEQKQDARALLDALP